MHGRGKAERQVVDALHARAIDAGGALHARAIDAGGAQPGRPLSVPPGSAAWPIGTALLVALLAGAALGIGLALLSVLVPGLLPAFG
ncbi:MAG: hypothetical protein ACRDRK_08650 [Pseudonocardia sp.]